ncbi:MAG: deoxyribose-phosphate aldolase [Methanothermobacter sp.]
MIPYKNLARKIDHTNLRADATEKDIKKLCDEAQLYNFKCVCVNPANIALAVDNIKNHDTGVCTVVGFPLGAITTEGKVFITGEAVKKNAAEIDMVMNIGHLKSGRDELVFKDIQGVVEAADGKLVKVILETALLTREEKVKASLLAKKAGADFVKTSTGSGGLTGATVEDITLLKKTVGKNMGVKASGGIRDLKTVLSMLNAGADRIGTSSGVQIMKEHGDY